MKYTLRVNDGTAELVKDGMVCAAVPVEDAERWRSRSPSHRSGIMTNGLVIQSTGPLLTRTSLGVLVWRIENAQGVGPFWIRDAWDAHVACLDGQEYYEASEALHRAGQSFPGVRNGIPQPYSHEQVYGFSCPFALRYALDAALPWFERFGFIATLWESPDAYLVHHESRQVLFHRPQARLIGHAPPTRTVVDLVIS